MSQSLKNQIQGENAKRGQLRKQEGDTGLGGLFLIALGVYLLLINFGYATWFSFYQILQYWPVLLIYWGLQLLIRNKLVWRIIFGFLSLVLLFLAASLIMGWSVDQQLPHLWREMIMQRHWLN